MTKILILVGDFFVIAKFKEILRDQKKDQFKEFD